MKRILITGASGFIGSFLVEEALDRGYEAWAGIRSSSSREYLTDERIHFVDLGFSDKELLKEQLQKHAQEYGAWDYVIHNAGATKCLHPTDFERINYRYTRHLIEALQETGLAPRKFILMSSLSASAAEEDTAYGRSKLQAEAFLRAQQSFPYIILRPTGVYGPREKDYYLMLKTIRAGLDVAAGWKPQHLSFIYVKDLVKAAFLALESPLTNKTYAVADGAVYTDAEYTRIARDAMNKKWVVRLKLPLGVVRLASMVAEDTAKLFGKTSTLNRDKYKIMKQRDWSCDITPLRTELGFEPEYDLRRGMNECVAWYRENGWL